LNPAVNEDHWAFGFLRAFQRRFPSGAFSSRKEDHVNALVNARRKGVNLRFLVHTGRRSELQVETLIFSEGVLNVRLVGFTPCTFGANSNESDGCQIVVSVSAV